MQGRTYVVEDRTSESDQPRMSKTDDEFMGQQWPQTGSQLLAKGQDIADDRVAGFDSACSRTDQCDIAQ